MPLTVDYKEKFYAAGRFPGGFMKREGKSSDYEILVSRLIDRPIRPLWPDDFHLEVFVNVTLISAEKDIQPDALAGLAASCALATSDLPFGGPISEVRVSRINGEFVINPSFSQMKDSDLELMVAATEENIMMVEGEMNEVSEHDMLEAIKFAHEEIKRHCQVQKELMHDLGTDEVVHLLLDGRRRGVDDATSAMLSPRPPSLRKSVKRALLPSKKSSLPLFLKRSLRRRLRS